MIRAETGQSITATSQAALPKTHLVYFSPTGTTRNIVKQVAAGLDRPELADYDLTRMDQDFALHLDEGLAIIAAPVYAGRVPELFLKRIQHLSGAGIPAVVIALYGNRAYEDALLELRDVIGDKGFRVIAAGAFIGEHSFATRQSPVATGRPDGADLQLAREFGASVARTLRATHPRAGLDVPGNTPYKERVALGGICPETQPELCTLCKTCAERCPAFLITVDQKVTTKAEGCLMCSACVKSCPQSARALLHPTVEARRDMLVTNCGERKAPSWMIVSF
jgi:ferredoxin/flavodoxin